MAFLTLQRLILVYKWDIWSKTTSTRLYTRGNEHLNIRFDLMGTSNVHWSDFVVVFVSI